MLLPKTMTVHQIARIVMLVREGVQVNLQEQYMDSTVSAIWVKIGGSKPMFLGVIYREHQHIYQPQPNDSGLPAKQNERWYKFVDCSCQLRCDDLRIFKSGLLKVGSPRTRTSKNGQQSER